MVSVRINGEQASVRLDGVQRVTDLIELIKATIDPDQMITAVLLDGRDLTEDDWKANLANFGTAIIEFETGDPDDFVRSRFAEAAGVVRSCYIQVRDARKEFQGGRMSEGNRLLVKAVDTLRAFFEWYSTILQLTTSEQRPTYDINPQVEQIGEVCKRICQQQLYQSWWALGETLEKELEPKLDQLEDFCRKFEVQEV